MDRRAGEGEILGEGFPIGDLDGDRRTDDRRREAKSLREAIVIGLQNEMRESVVRRERETRVCGLCVRAICTAAVPNFSNIRFFFLLFILLFTSFWKFEWMDHDVLKTTSFQFG